MKLVKIEDVRVGQIWQLHNLIGLVKEIDKGLNNLLKIALFQLYPTEGGIETESVHNIITKHKLIGKLGITHEIRDNRLVEIPRDEFQVDDVVTYFDFDHCENIGVVISIYDRDEYTSYSFITNKGIYDTDDCFEHEEIGEDTGIYTYTPKKIGILGVTHEFVNDCEVKND